MLVLVLVLVLLLLPLPLPLLLPLPTSLGWNDVSFHGSEQVPTPTLDRLAKAGVILKCVRIYYPAQAAPGAVFCLCLWRC